MTEVETCNSMVEAVMEMAGYAAVKKKLMVEVVDYNVYVDTALVVVAVMERVALAVAVAMAAYSVVKKTLMVKVVDYEI